MFVEYITVVPVEGIEQYVLSNPSEVVHFFVPPRGSCHLCAPLAARCGLAEQMYHTKRILGSLQSVASTSSC